MSETLGDAVLELRTDNAPLERGLALAYDRVKANGLKSKTAWVGAMAAAAAGTAIAAYKIGQEFDTAYDKIRVGTGKTGKVLEGLKNDFREVVRDVPTDFDSASTAVTELHKRLDLTGRPLQQRAKQFLELSRITGEDLTASIEASTRLFEDWSVKSDKQGATLDKLFRVSQETGIGITELSQSLVQFGSPLRQLGFDLDTSAAMFAKFEKEGVNVQTLMPGLRMGLKNLSQPTDELKQKLKELGVAGEDPDKALRAIFKAIEDAPSTLEANSLAFDVFGARAGPDLAAAVREGRFAFDDLIKTMRSGKDTIRGAGRDTMDFSEHLQKFKNNVLVELEPVAIRVFDAVGSAMKDVTKIISDPKLSGAEKFEKLLDLVSKAIENALPRIVETGGKIAGAVIEGFLDAPIWAQFLAGAWLLKGVALKGIGKAAGGLIGTPMGLAIAAAAASAFAGARLSDELVGDPDSFIPLRSRDILDEIAEQFDITRNKAERLQRFMQRNPGLGVPEALSAMNREARKKFGAIGDEIDSFSNTWGLSMREIEKRTERNMRDIERTMGKHSARGRRALADNFFAAADAIRNSIKTGEIDSKKGLQRIEQLMMKALQAYGIKNPETVLQETERRADAPNPYKRAMGGGVPIPGFGEGDKVPVTVGGVPVALTEPGERMFILNKNANAALEQLQRLNGAVRRRDGGFVDLWGRGLAHLARGGTIPGDTAGLHPEIMALMNQLYRVAGGSVSSGLRPGDDGFHGSGRAADWVGGNWEVAARFINSVGPKLLEGIYNPALMGGQAVSWDAGSRVPSSFWGGSTWAGHQDHIHAAIAAMVEGVRMGRIKLPRFLALTQFATSSAEALNNVSFGLEERLNRGLSSIEGSESGISPGAVAGGDFTKAELMALWTRVNGSLGDPNLMAAIALAESGGDPNIVNEIGAGGLWQIHPPEPNYLDPVVNATIAGRKFRESGLSPWEAYTNGAYQQFMKRGGLVRGFAKGGIVDLIDAFVGHYKGTEGAGERRRLISETAKRIKDSKQLGFEKLTPDGSALAGDLLALREQSDQWGEWASHAGALTSTDAEGNDIPGVFQDRDEAGWLTEQLGSLFALRNALVIAGEAMEKVRKRVRKMVDDAKKQLEDVKKAIKEGERERRRLEKDRRDLEKQLEKASADKERDNKLIEQKIEREMAKPPKKRDEALIKRWREQLHSKSSEKDAIREQLAANAEQLAALDEKQIRRGQLRDALKGPISDALGGRVQAIHTGQQTLADERISVQGSGFDEEWMPSLPDLGVLGGEIFDVQLQLRELGAPDPEITDEPPTEEADEGFSIAELLDLAEAIRYGVFDQDLVSRAPALHGGGVVGGGGDFGGTEEVIRRLLPGEGVVDDETMRDGLSLAGGRYRFVMENWEEGRGYFERIADGQIDEGNRRGRAAWLAGKHG